MSELPGGPELFRSIVESAPDAMVIVDAGGLIVLANAQTEVIFGYPREELLGEPIEMLVPARFHGDHKAHRDGFVLSPSARPMGVGRELHAARRDGTEFPVEISLSPIPSEHGIFVSAAIRDISERRALESASTRVREQLIATVSHELRTPLASIIGYAELLAEMAPDQLPDAARRLVEVIERNAHRELRLVDDLLTLAFVEDERLAATKEPVRLGGVAAAVVEDALVRGRADRVTIELDQDPGVAVSGDAFRMAQVVEILVTNAVKFSPAGGRVTVRVSRDEDRAVLEVEDTGMGIHRHEIERLFERLYRTPAAIEMQIQGAGLGLPIARAIVVAHGGEIQVQSTPGVGSCFRVLLPALVMSAAATS